MSARRAKTRCANPSVAFFADIVKYRIPVFSNRRARVRALPAFPFFGAGLAAFGIDMLLLSGMFHYITGHAHGPRKKRVAPTGAGPGGTAVDHSLRRGLFPASRIFFRNRIDAGVISTSSSSLMN